MREEAQASLAGGVASSLAGRATGRGVDRPRQPAPRIWDVDGFEYSDFHGGFGVGLAGHAHPAIVEAVHAGA